VGSSGYSWWLKRIVVVDVILLSALYMLRLVAGSVATQVPISKWLLLFSIFFFSSLALLKRYVELTQQGQTKRRGYKVSQREMVWRVGIGSGLASAIVLALYVLQSRQITLLYTRAWLWWLVCGLFLFWMGRVWYLARHSRLPDDPVVFALRDRMTWSLGLLTAVILFVAAG
jgi:4-hydroxybenzoate polyprenyltransferase